MKKIVAALALATAFIAPSHAAVVYTSSAEFLPQVATGAYTNAFNMPYGGNFSYNFTDGHYGYTVFAPNGIYSSGDFIGVNRRSEDITISFTGATVTAVGGNFFNTDVDDNFQATDITITLSDGSTTTFTPGSVTNSYRGFTTDIGIASIRISAGEFDFQAIDNLTVGAAIPDAAAVPEPASLALLGGGLLGLAGLRRQRRC